LPSGHAEPSCEGSWFAWPTASGSHESTLYNVYYVKSCGDQSGSPGRPAGSALLLHLCRRRSTGPLPTVGAAAKWLFIQGVVGSAVGSVTVGCKACADAMSPLLLWRDIDLMLAGLPILRPAFIEEIRRNQKKIGDQALVSTLPASTLTAGMTQAARASEVDAPSRCCLGWMRPFLSARPSQLETSRPHQPSQCPRRGLVGPRGPLHALDLLVEGVFPSFSRRRRVGFRARLGL
jgi:hypothetical protein